MTSDPEARKRSIAALKLWKPGQSGNPNGRTTLGATLNECVNAMKGRTRSEVQGIADDDDRSVEWRAAATRVLGMLEPGWHGHIPLGGSDFDRIMDRTVGKPVQAVHVTTTTIRPPAVIGVDKAPLVLQCFASIPPAERPALLKQMMALDPPALEAEPVDSA